MRAHCGSGTESSWRYLRRTRHHGKISTILHLKQYEGQIEVRAIRGAVHDIVTSKNKPWKWWWICGVFPGKEVDEDDVRRWVRAALGDGGLPHPWGIGGVNCSRVENLSPVVSIMHNEVQRLIDQDQFVDEWRAFRQRPWLVLYPEGTQGGEYDPATKSWIQMEDASMRPWDEVYLEMARQLKPADWEGVVIGGCCRTKPEHIAVLRWKLENS